MFQIDEVLTQDVFDAVRGNREYGFLVCFPHDPKSSWTWLMTPGGARSMLEENALTVHANKASENLSDDESWAKAVVWSEPLVVVPVNQKNLMFEPNKMLIHGLQYRCILSEKWKAWYVFLTKPIKTMIGRNKSIIGKTECGSPNFCRWSEVYRFGLPSSELVVLSKCKRCGWNEVYFDNCGGDTYSQPCFRTYVVYHA